MFLVLADFVVTVEKRYGVLVEKLYRSGCRWAQLGWIIVAACKHRGSWLELTATEN